MTDTPLLPFIHPATGEKYGEIPFSSPAEIERALADLRISHSVWSKRSLRERIRVLRAFQGYLVDRADEIADTISYATGKSPQDGLAEVFMTVDLLNHYCSKAPGWLKPHLAIPGITVLFKLPVIQYRSRGVVAIIGPWNYPFNLNLVPAISALLAGNTVCIKPSEVTGAVSHLIDTLFKEFSPLAPFVRVLHGDGRVGAAMIEKQPDYIYLTGSIETARKVMAQAARHLIPCGFELGGKDPALILSDADLPAAAKWTVWGAVYNAGQSCMAIERVYVMEDVYDRFLDLVIREVDAIKVGYSRSKNSPYHYGPLTSSSQLKIVTEQTKDALDQGAQVIRGGTSAGLFFSPTILTGINHKMLIMQDENFGPVVPIVKVKNEQEAIRLANDSKFGLGASVWSRDLNHAYQVASQLSASSVMINDAVVQFTVSTTPYGGIKLSGNVSSHGKHGLLEFTTPQVVMVGPPPQSFDIATLLRAPGRYHLEKILVNLLFGRSIAQRLAPLQETLRQLQSQSDLNRLSSSIPIEKSSASKKHPAPPRIQGKLQKWAASSTLPRLAAASLVLSAFTLLLRRSTKNR